MYEKEAAHRCVCSARQNCTDRAVQTGTPLLSYEAEQWQNNLPELDLSTRLILGKAGVKRQTKDWGWKLFHGIVSQKLPLGLQLKNLSPQVSLWGESHLCLLLKGCCLLAAQHWCPEQSTMQFSWCFSSYMSQSCQVWKSGIWLQVSLAALQFHCRPISQKWPATSSSAKKSLSHPLKLLLSPTESSFTGCWAAELQQYTDLGAPTLFLECQQVQSDPQDKADWDLRNGHIHTQEYPLRLGFMTS